jgi:hypothetical protein
MDYRTGYNDGFRAGVEAALRFPTMSPTTVANPFDMLPTTPAMPTVSSTKPKRKASAYSKAYGRAYRSLRRKNTLKSGKLRKGVTHKKLVKMAHAEAKKSRRSK